MILPVELLAIRLGRAQTIISTRTAPIRLRECRRLAFGAQINVIILEMIQTARLHRPEDCAELLHGKRNER